MSFPVSHPQSRALLNSWRALNGLDGPNELAEARARDASGIVERLFMLQRIGEGVFVFKTCGGALRSWAGRDLRDQELGTLFAGSEKVLIRALIESALEAPGPALAHARAFGAGVHAIANVEFVFLPLIDHGQANRVLGLFQPMSERKEDDRPVLRFALTGLFPPEQAKNGQPTGGKGGPKLVYSREKAVKMPKPVNDN